MSNEIATRDEQQPHGLAAWAEDARIAANLAKSLAKTSDARKFGGNEAEIAAVILKGQEMGLKPFAALAAFDVIQGTVAPRAHAMRGLVQAQGHVIEVVQSTPKLCVVRGRRKDSAEWQQVEWPIERAAQMGLTGKSEWKKQPQTMLVNRATAEMCRLLASDVLFGIPYAAEEIDAPSVPVAVTRVSAADYLEPEQVDTSTGEIQDVEVEDPPGWEQDR